MGRPQVDRALLADGGMASRNEGVAASYAVGCPDVLQLAVDARPDLTGRKEIGPDGCIDLGQSGRLRVEGQPLSAVARQIAARVGVPPVWVHVRVSEFRSEQIYLIGQVAGNQRAVAYQGPETVLDLLHRAGGVTAGAAPDEVYVLRSHVAEGRLPEVFRINLKAILLRHDQETNVRLQPGDQVFVGETRECCLERCLPPWLRPVLQTVCGTRREKAPGTSPIPQEEPDRAVVRAVSSTSFPVSPEARQ
jgi:protein involved in polysaccharide export with SLBB domain